MSANQIILQSGQLSHLISRTRSLNFHIHPVDQICIHIQTHITNVVGTISIEQRGAIFVSTDVKTRLSLQAATYVIFLPLNVFFHASHFIEPLLIHLPRVSGADFI